MITPKIIIVSTILFLVASSFIYLYVEVNNFVSKPRLNIIKPVDGMTVTGSSTHVVGIAEKGALVFINDQPVLVNEKGEEIINENNKALAILAASLPSSPESRSRSS